MNADPGSVQSEVCAGCSQGGAACPSGSVHPVFIPSKSSASKLALFTTWPCSLSGRMTTEGTKSEPMGGLPVRAHHWKLFLSLVSSFLIRGAVQECVVSTVKSKEFISIRYIPGSGIAASYGSSIF